MQFKAVRKSDQRFMLKSRHAFGSAALVIGLIAVPVTSSIGSQSASPSSSILILEDPPTSASPVPPPPADAAGDGSLDHGPIVADHANEVLLSLKDGRRFQGILIEKNTQKVVLRIAGIDTAFNAADVSDVIALKTFDEYFKDLKASIKPDDYEARYRLCEWIFHRGRLETAATELEALLDDNPRLDNARELLRKVNAAISLMENSAPVPGVPGASPGDAGGAEDADGARQMLPSVLLNSDQVNLLKVYETDLKNPPRLLVHRATIDRLFSEYGKSDLLPADPDQRKAFYQEDPVHIVRVIFQLQARDLYPEIQVLSEPASLNKFRLNVHRVWLMNSCATNLCHGGVEAGDFFLFNRNPNDLRTVYTNFLILDRTKINGRPLLNYDKPEDSLLLQLGLPREISDHPHPDVEHWRPTFRSPTDPMFQRAVDWIKSMYQPRPIYPIQYTMPLDQLKQKNMLTPSPQPPQSTPAPAEKDRHVEPGGAGNTPTNTPGSPDRDGGGGH